MIKIERIGKMYYVDGEPVGVTPRLVKNALRKYNITPVVLENAIGQARLHGDVEVYIEDRCWVNSRMLRVPR